MLTLLILFCIISVFLGVLGLVLHVAFHVFKWLFLLALVAGAVLLVAVFAVPLLLVAPAVLAIGILFLLGCLLF